MAKVLYPLSLSNQLATTVAPSLEFFRTELPIENFLDFCGWIVSLYHKPCDLFRNKKEKLAFFGKEIQTYKNELCIVII
jgi:hypothetical protein